MKETEVMNAILDYLWYNKIFCWRSNNIPVYDTARQVFRAMPKGSIKGIADILGIYKGKLLAIECKVKGAYPSAEQKEFIKNIIDNGGIAFVARSIDDVKNNGIV